MVNKVLLPEPEGPVIIINSPAFAVKLMLFKTLNLFWLSPKLLLILVNLIVSMLASNCFCWINSYNH